MAHKNTASSRRNEQQMAERPNQEPTNPSKESSEAFFKAVEKIPYVGASLVFIIKKWGWSGLALFAVGALLALTLIKFHALPDWFVSDLYKSQAGGTPEPPSRRAKPLDFNVELITDEPIWLKTQLNLLREEGVLRQSADSNLRFTIRAVDYTFREATDDFKWLLVTESNFEITATAFRITTQGLLQPLDSSNQQHTVGFQVPKCEKGDRLVALVRVQYYGDQPVTDIRSTFRSTIKQE